MKNEKHILYSVCEKLLVKDHGGRHCKNFAKLEFWKLEHVKLFLVKHTIQFLGRDITI